MISRSNATCKELVVNLENQKYKSSPVRHTKQAAIVYPSQTQIQDCHQERPPPLIIELAIIQVFYGGRG
jgi:hypothetical protein